jgi:ABC-type nitrate/sulfonate/bicarbonate transport system substrate-binding protein
MRAIVRVFRLPIAVHVVLVATALCACAQDARLRVNTFPGPQNLALFVAQDKGLFAKRGLSVEISFTPNSQAQRDGLVKGAFEIAQAGVDNAVALVEVAKQDVVIVAGGSNGMNELIVRPELKSYDDIRGKMVVVDAPNTAYAFLLYKMLALKGVNKGDYAVLPAGGCTQRLDAMREDNTRVAAMMNPPCNLIAAKEGYHSFGLATDVIGSYQADGIWVMRAWANGNSAILTKYLEAIIEGCRWGSDPANRTEAAAIVAKHLKLDPEIAEKSVEAAVGASGGFAKDARFDMEGFKTTLRLRAEIAGGDANPAPGKYLDLSYYQRALSMLH